MWRREVIRLVLACNWIVFALSCGAAVHGHGVIWRGTSHRLVGEEKAERGEDPWSDPMAEADVQRAEQYRGRTEMLYLSGGNGWWVACGASFGTAVLLMIAFPKKQPTGERPA